MPLNENVLQTHYVHVFVTYSLATIVIVQELLMLSRVLHMSFPFCSTAKHLVLFSDLENHFRSILHFSFSVEQQ